MFTDIKKVSVVPQTILEQNPSPKGNNLPRPKYSNIRVHQVTNCLTQTLQCC